MVTRVRPGRSVRAEANCVASASALHAALPLAPAELQLWLEWAGSKLLSLPTRSPLPQGPHVSWPLFAQDHHVAYGYTPERLRPARASDKEIDLMDEILIFPSLITDINTRRVVNARILVTPLGNRYLYSWARLAQLLHADRRTVSRLYAKGLEEISRKAPRAKVDAVRETFVRLTN